MGPKERREREREEIRTSILDAARELFASEGVEAVTMRRIAEKIEYSPTAIYFHFKDKEALLTELCECDFREFAHRFAEAAQIADPIDRLRASGQAYVEFGLNHQSHYRVMFMTPKPALTPNMDDRGNPQEDAYALLRNTIEQAMAEGRLKPELTNVDLVSQVIWSGVHGIVSLEIAKCNDAWIDFAPIQERAKLMVETLIEGVSRGR